MLKEVGKMNLDKNEYIQRVIAGTYEVLDLADYDIEKSVEVVDKVKGFLSEERISEVDLLNSHYAYVSSLLSAVEEWDIVIENLDSTIKEVLDKTYLDREAMIIQNEIIKVLVNEFDKDEKIAKELVNKENIRKQIDGYSMSIHFSSMDWALRILTRNKDIEALEKYS